MILFNSANFCISYFANLSLLQTVHFLEYTVSHSDFFYMFFFVSGFHPVTFDLVLFLIWTVSFLEGVIDIYTLYKNMMQMDI